MKVLRAFGIDWMATRWAWAGFLWRAALGILIAFLGSTSHGAGAKLVVGLGFWGLIEASMIAHQLGAVATGSLVNARMAAAVATGTLYYNVYDGAGTLSRRVHLLRALGGPLGDLLLGAPALAAYLAGVHSQFLLFLAVLNLLFTTISLMPLPTLDGGAIISALRGPREL